MTRARSFLFAPVAVEAAPPASIPESEVAPDDQPSSPPSRITVEPEAAGGGATTDPRDMTFDELLRLEAQIKQCYDYAERELCRTWERYERSFAHVDGAVRAYSFRLAAEENGRMRQAAWGKETFRFLSNLGGRRRRDSPGRPAAAEGG